MNIGFFRSLIEIEKYHSISKAAQNMNISQPALSQQVKLFEELYSVTLLNRSNNGISLTEAGTIVHQYALQFIENYDRMICDISDCTTRNARLNIVAAPTVYSYLLPCTLFFVKQNYSSYFLDIKSSSSKSVEEQIHLGTADVGFITGKPSDNKLYHKLVFTETHYLVAKEDFNISDTIAKNDLYKYPLLMLDKQQKTRQLMSRQLKRNGIDENKLIIPYELDSIESIKISIMQGYGIAILPYISIKRELYTRQLKIINCKDVEFDFEYYMIHNNKLANQHKSIVGYLEKTIRSTKCS